MRLFIALDPSEEQRGKLQALQLRLARSLDGVKWVRPEGLHLTLKFLGEQQAEVVPSIAAAMRKAAASAGPFELQYGGAGVFPSPGRARIVWSGILGGAGETKNLAASLERELVKKGFPPENRPFRAHITLGRARMPLPEKELLRLLDTEGSFTTGPAPATSMRLYESRLTPQGAHYTALEEILLMDK